MQNKLNLFLLVFVLLTLSVGGKPNFTIGPAEAHESLDLNLIEIDLEPVSTALLEQECKSGILLAQKNCGNESCSAEECCCLNIDTGAQCCRPLGNSASCIEACKKSKPC